MFGYTGSEPEDWNGPFGGSVPTGGQLWQVQDILKTKSEQVEMPEETADIPEHENIRWKEYYK